MGEVVTAEEIRQWKDLPMVAYEAAVWDSLGRKFCPQTDERVVCCFVVLLGIIFTFQVCISRGDLMRSRDLFVTR